MMYITEKIDLYLDEGKNLTKAQVFRDILAVLNRNKENWMDIDTIVRYITTPMAKDGIKAHIYELVRKGKVKETIRKGKDVWKLAGDPKPEPKKQRYSIVGGKRINNI